MFDMSVSNILQDNFIQSELCYFQVSTDIDNKSGWKECFSVSGVRLPVGYYFGVSAATGDLAGNIYMSALFFHPHFLFINCLTK